MGIVMTGYTTPPPYVVAASSDTGGGPTTEAWRAFDGTEATTWITQPVGVPAYIQFDWNVNAFKLRRYSVLCSKFSFFPQRWPKDWIIEGSDDLFAWHLLATVTGQTNWLLIFDGATVRGVVGATPTATVTIVGYVVNADDVGRTLQITGGTNFLQAFYKVLSVNVGLNTWTLDAVCNIGAGIAMQGQFDRSLRYFDYDAAPAAYRYTRMTISANNGDVQYVAITELDLAVGGGWFNRVY